VNRSSLPIDHYEVGLRLAGGYDYKIGDVFTQEALLALIQALTLPDVNGPALITITVCPSMAPPGT